LRKAHRGEKDKKGHDQESDRQSVFSWACFAERHIETFEKRLFLTPAK
jgi:hypothetical protein